MKWWFKDWLTNNLGFFFIREIKITDISVKSATTIGKMLSKVKRGDTLMCTFKNNYKLVFNIK